MPGDGKSLVQLKTREQQLLTIAGQNRGRLKAFKKSQEVDSATYFFPDPLDFSIIFHLLDGSTVRKELYHGSGFLSQSTRWLKIPPAAQEMEKTAYSGQVRKLTVPSEIK